MMQPATQPVNVTSPSGDLSSLTQSGATAEIVEAIVEPLAPSVLSNLDEDSVRDPQGDGVGTFIVPPEPSSPREAVSEGKA